MAKVKIIAKIRPFIGNEPVDDALSTEGNVISLKDSRNSAQRIQYECVSRPLASLNLVIVMAIAIQQKGKRAY